MIVDERIVTFINSLDTENSRILEEIEKEAHASDVPVIRREMIPGHTAELRLFAIRPEYRKTPLAPRLGATIFKKLDEMGYRLLIISGISEQKDFYEHIGFRAVGGPVQDGEALFYPMVADLPPILRRCALAVARCTK